MAKALGMIETAGYGAAFAAADEALKAANVKILKFEITLGSGGTLGVTAFISGEVAAVQAAVEAGRLEAERVNRVISYSVNPNIDMQVNDNILNVF